MCGRFNVTSDTVRKLIVEITGRGFEITTQLNIAPTETVPVLRVIDSDHALDELRWWLVPYWSDTPSTQYAMFNARAEGLTRSRAFREPFLRRRCIIPASGYYEWQVERGTRVPVYIAPENEDAFAFAGLWDRWQGDDQVIESCTIITAAAPHALAALHDRVPVSLATDDVHRWLAADTSRDELQRLLAPGAVCPVRVTPVSTIVNNARNKDERCLEPIGPTQVLG